MSSPSPAYKLRTQIAKALQIRSHAIQTALTNYNRLAAALDPPRPILNFKEVIEYSSLAEFDILRDTRGTVQSRIWAQPSYRTAMAYYFKVKCARAEIKRLNVEITRLRTFIRDDEALHSQVIKTLRTTNPGLATVLSHQWELRAQLNLIHLARLDSAGRLHGYTGAVQCGTRKGHSSPVGDVYSQVQRADDLGHVETDAGLLGEEDLQDALNLISDFISNAQ